MSEKQMIYYRRTGRPYAYPATKPDDVEVVSDLPDGERVGPGDGDWKQATVNVEDQMLEPEDDPGCEPGRIADDLYCDSAMRRYLGFPDYDRHGWGCFTPEELDNTGPDAHEAMCDAVEIAFGLDAANKQRRLLASRLSADYLRSHGIEED